MGANPITNDDPLFIRMSVSKLGVAKGRAQDLLDVDPTEFLVDGALDVARESPLKPLAFLVKNTIRHNVRSPLWLKRITSVKDDINWERSTVF